MAPRRYWNAAVVQALLDNLVERGLDPKVCRLFIMINIRFIAQRPSRSSDCAASQLGSTISWPSRARTRGRVSDTLPP
jgi:hypothetical protein